MTQGNREVETALFRIVQESLSNVHRHASTTTAAVRLTATPDAVVLEIQDQGHGIRDQLPQQHGTLLPATLGVGIQGMRERVRQLGGIFDVEFTDRGTTVRVRAPLNHDTPRRQSASSSPGPAEVPGNTESTV